MLPNTQNLQTIYTYVDMSRRVIPPLCFALSLIACGSDPDPMGSEQGTESDASTPAEDDGDETPSDEPTPEDDGENTESSAESGDSSGSDSSGGEPQGIPVLGSLTHSIDNVEYSIISEQDFARPSDLEFNPEVEGELWVTNLDDDTITIIENAGRSGQTQSRKETGDGSNHHFLARPSGIAFGQPGVMATSQQTDLITQSTTPWDFMGPTMWGTNAATFDSGHSSHLDMLHNSPNSSGIAWESDNIYWVFDGEHGSLTRYNFHEDHGLGGTYHGDGEVYRIAAAELGYEANVASHVAYEPSTGYVYAADTANNRIFVLDSATGEIAGDIAPNYDGGIQRGVNGAEFMTLVNGGDLTAPMGKPSGLEIHDNYLFVTDYETSTIYGLTLEGELVDWLETGIPANSLMGIAFDTDGSMYGVNAATNAVYRIAALEE